MKATDAYHKARGWPGNLKKIMKEIEIAANNGDLTVTISDLVLDSTEVTILKKLGYHVEVCKRHRWYQTDSDAPTMPTIYINWEKNV